jgi:hypothetical protein
MYHIEEIMCECICKNIAEYLSAKKNFIPYYKNSETGETMIIKDVYTRIRYSRALSDLLDLTAKQYEESQND